MAAFGQVLASFPNFVHKPICKTLCRDRQIREVLFRRALVIPEHYPILSVCVSCSRIETQLVATPVVVKRH